MITTFRVVGIDPSPGKPFFAASIVAAVEAGDRCSILLEELKRFGQLSGEIGAHEFASWLRGWREGGDPGDEFRVACETQFIAAFAGNPAAAFKAVGAALAMASDQGHIRAVAYGLRCPFLALTQSAWRARLVGADGLTLSKVKGSGEKKRASVAFVRACVSSGLLLRAPGVVIPPGDDAAESICIALSVLAADVPLNPYVAGAARLEQPA